MTGTCAVFEDDRCYYHAAAAVYYPSKVAKQLRGAFLKYAKIKVRASKRQLLDR
jgi:hypothetical protein